MDDAANRLARETVLEHYSNPKNRGMLEHPDRSHEANNPLCGDEVRIDVNLADDRITEVRFSGRGCTVSQAAASILTEMVEGKPVADVITIGRDDLFAEIGIPISPARERCALLGLEALQAALTVGDD